MVWELDGPMPILNRSKTLTADALKEAASLPPIGRQIYALRLRAGVATRRINPSLAINPIMGMDGDFFRAAPYQ